MHTFSMTCKAESVIDLFGEKAERAKAIRWFHAHSITRLYIESYRHGRLVSEDRLRTVRDECAAAGFAVGGCITPTCLSERNDRGIVTCFSDPAAQAVLQQIVELTASCFDFIILDDFMFTNCTCASCEEARGEMTWQEYRCELMLQIGRDAVLEPARAVNPNVQISIKYPLWYELYAEQGYDVVRETELYDATWIGTETRDPDSWEAGRRPQTSASWIQGWMNDISQGKCGGGWYDPIDTSPHTFLEQARQTIIGGARESLLHCYDYLGTTTPGIAVHARDLEVKNGLADAEAFRQEAEGLQLLATMLANLEPYGVLVPNRPSQRFFEHQEAYLPGFVGMLGIPAVAAASLKPFDAAFFGVQVSGFDEIEDCIRGACREGRPLVVTQGLVDVLKAAGKELPPELSSQGSIESGGNSQAEIVHLTGTLSLLRCSDDLWGLTALAQEELDSLRNRLLKPFEIEFSAPAGVSLHLFRSSGALCEVFENFNDLPIEAEITFSGENRGERVAGLALPSSCDASLHQNDPGNYTIVLPPHSLLAISTCESSRDSL